MGCNRRTLKRALREEVEEEFTRAAGRDRAFRGGRFSPCTSVGFAELMPKTLATATVDRLLHHAHVCQTSGDSIRLAQALAGKGVTPMS